MESMEYNIFTFVLGILIIITLYWLYIDHSEKADMIARKMNRAFRKPVIGAEASQIYDYHSRTIEMKNSGVAVILSFFVPGLGQIYNGQILKGVIFIILHGISVVIAIILIVGGAFTANGTAILIGILLYPIFWVYNLYDAYNTAAITHL